MFVNAISPRFLHGTMSSHIFQLCLIVIPAVSGRLLQNVCIMFQKSISSIWHLLTHLYCFHPEMLSEQKSKLHYTSWYDFIITKWIFTGILPSLLQKNNTDSQNTFSKHKMAVGRASNVGFGFLSIWCGSCDDVVTFFAVAPPHVNTGAWQSVTVTVICMCRGSGECAVAACGPVMEQIVVVVARGGPVCCVLVL